MKLLTIYEDLKSSEVEKLKLQLKTIEQWFSPQTSGHPDWDIQRKRAAEIRKQLFKLTGDYNGESADEKTSTNKKPDGLDDKYDHPTDVPVEVYRWIYTHDSLLYSDASDAVRWSRIINTRNDDRYQSGTITIYRAVEFQYRNSEIREGDWVTIDIKYAEMHNDRYFNGNGVILELDVDGSDVLTSPTGDPEEAIYAPLEFSIDIDI